jgi:RNA polymerase sigma-70 factor (family 1)
MTDYTKNDDTVLLSLLSQGDEAAFGVLFERYRSRLYYYLIRHTKSPEIAEEIVTDIFMKLWTGRELAHQINDAAAFFHKVGYYKAMDFLRTTARHTKLQQLYIQRMEPVAEQQPDELLIDAETKTLLLQAVNQLPPQRKLIYQLSRQEGMTHEEIAQALGLSRSTVNNAMVAATRSIARFLHDNTNGKAALSVFMLFA